MKIIKKNKLCFLPHHLKFLPVSDRHNRKRFTQVHIKNLGYLYQINENIFINKAFCLSIKHELLYFYLLNTFVNKLDELKRANLKISDNKKIQIMHKDIAKYIGYTDLSFKWKVITYDNSSKKIDQKEMNVVEYINYLIAELKEYQITYKITQNVDSYSENPGIYYIIKVDNDIKAESDKKYYTKKQAYLKEHNMYENDNEIYKRYHFKDFKEGETSKDKYAFARLMFPLEHIYISIDNKELTQSYIQFDLEEIDLKFKESESLLLSYYKNLKYLYGYEIPKKIFLAENKRLLWIYIYQGNGIKQNRKKWNPTNFNSLFDFINHTFYYQEFNNVRSKRVMKHKLRKKLVSAIIEFLQTEAIILRVVSSNKLGDYYYREQNLYKGKADESIKIDNELLEEVILNSKYYLEIVDIDKFKQMEV